MSLNLRYYMNITVRFVTPLSVEVGASNLEFIPLQYNDKTNTLSSLESYDFQVDPHLWI